MLLRRSTIEWAMPKEVDISKLENYFFKGQINTLYH